MVDAALRPGDAADALVRDGFAFVRAPAMRALLGTPAPADWAAFAASWNDLGLDTYMADGGRYRRRRHATFAAQTGVPAIARAPHQPHYQSRDYNQLNGGIARWFEPVSEPVGTGPALNAILRFCRGLFDRLAP